MAPAEASRTASSRGVNSRGVSQPRTGGASDTGARPRGSDRTGGSSSHNDVPAAVVAAPTASSATPVDVLVASSTPSAGPAMNDTSMDMESSE